MPDGGKITTETGNRWFDRRTATERGFEAGQYISLCVSDTGAGMPLEVQAKAFAVNALARRIRELIEA